MNTLESTEKAEPSPESSNGVRPQKAFSGLTPLQRFGVGIFKFFASLKLAIIVLVTLMAVLAAGTFLESSQGTDAARIVIYKSSWFAVLLLVLAFNLTASALDRLPWKKKHVGFVLTHLGIIIILFGSFMTQQMMVDGQMQIAEGETESRLTLPEPLLYIFSEEEHKTWFFDLPQHAFVWRGGKNIRLSNDGEEVPFSLQLQEYFPKALVEESIINAEGTTSLNAFREVVPSDQKGGGTFWNPALKIRLKNAFVEEHAWLMRGVEGKNETQMGPVHLVFAEGLLKESAPIEKTDQKNLEPYLEFSAEAGSSSGEKFANGKTVKIPLPGNLKLPATFKLDGTPYTIKIYSILKNAVVQGKTLIEDDPSDGVRPKKADSGLTPFEGRNPAVEFTLSGKGVEEKHTVFAKFPDFPTVHGMKPSAANMKVFYKIPGSVESGPASQTKKHEIRFVFQNEKLFCQIVDGEKVTTQEVEKQKEIHTGWMGGLTILPEEFYPAAKVQKKFQPQSNMTENPEAVPAVKLRVGSEIVWLRQGEPAEAVVDGQHLTLLFGQKKIQAGFKVQLKDFRLEQYPGTDHPASFESDVILKDDSRGIVKDITISMNKPLAYRGYHIYQSGYSLPGGQQAGSDEPHASGREISIFSVGKDPGVPVKYLGAIVMVAGILTMFYTRRFSTGSKNL